MRFLASVAVANLGVTEFHSTASLSCGQELQAAACALAIDCSSKMKLVDLSLSIEFRRCALIRRLASPYGLAEPIRESSQSVKVRLTLGSG